jgi:hypothetical protein
MNAPVLNTAISSGAAFGKGGGGDMGTGEMGAESLLNVFAKGADGAFVKSETNIGAGWNLEVAGGGGLFGMTDKARFQSGAASDTMGSVFKSFEDNSSSSSSSSESGGGGGDKKGSSGSGDSAHSAFDDAAGGFKDGGAKFGGEAGHGPKTPDNTPMIGQGARGIGGGGIGAV